MKSLEKQIIEICQKAKESSRTLLSISTETKNSALKKIAELLDDKRRLIQGENTKDIEQGKKTNLSEAMLDRLTLSDTVIDSMISGIQDIIALGDPVGKMDTIIPRPNGMMVGRMNVPLGVIGMIYESRPNVTVDSAALCLKAGNSVVLRGGSEAIHSNQALAKVLQEAMAISGVDGNCVQIIPVKDREAVSVLLRQDKYLDLIIPRGGEGLIRFVAENSSIPVLKHYKGVCHIYVDSDADLHKATPIIINSKAQRPGVCNALEGVLIHDEIAQEYIPVLSSALHKEGVGILGCKKSCALSDCIQPAGQTDWGTEFLELRLIMKVVSGYDEAKQYIATYGSNHTECIVTENYSLANKFVREIDASAVMVNASTRFNDGGELGLGAEIGISTTKLHAYGPMGLDELTTKKFVIYGEGQVRS